MKIHNVVQGSPEWHAARAKAFTASEAPAMMGESKYQTRADLLAQKAGVREQEVNAATQKLFDRGHATEAAIRPHIESLIGEDLFPVTGEIVVDGMRLLASFDGINMDETIGFEHKLLNQDLIAQVQAGELEPHYYWQLEQQLLVSEAEKIIFVTSDGTPDNCYTLEYTSLPCRRQKLIAGWKQFAEDLANYEHKPVVVAPVGRAPEELPALRVEVTGMVTASNLDAFKAAALAVFNGINRDLQTDDDFADAEKTVKWCKAVEDKLAAAKESAIAQTQSIDELFKAIDQISDEARTVRLELEKLVKDEKENKRVAILNGARQALADYINGIEAGRLAGRIRMPEVPADFALAMKGKKTVASLQDAADTVLAQAKIQASALANVIATNLSTLDAKAEGFGFLFGDIQQVIQKAPDDFALLVESRVNHHKAAEAARIEAEVQRRQAEAKPVVQEAQAPTSAPVATEVQAYAFADEFKVEPITDNGHRIKLGDINAAIAPLSISADGLAQLGFEPVAMERASKLYAASDLPKILAAMIKHLSSAQHCTRIAA